MLRDISLQGRVYLVVYHRGAYLVYDTALEHLYIAYSLMLLLVVSV